MRLNAFQRQILDGTIRLPMPQRPGENATLNLQASLLDQDALRRAGTSRTSVAKGYLKPIQVFHGPAGEQGTNSEAALVSGLVVANARRLVNKGRGQGAGV